MNEVEPNALMREIDRRITGLVFPEGHACNVLLLSAAPLTLMLTKRITPSLEVKYGNGIMNYGMPRSLGSYRS